MLLTILALPDGTRADPLDEVGRRTFHITTLGGFDQSAVPTSSIINYRAKMLALTGGVMPKNLKVGVSVGVEFLLFTQGSYYDYLYNPANLDQQVAVAAGGDLSFGAFINGMPWADDPNQAVDNLHNYLEKYDGGSLLQVDRLGHIRNAALAQDPTIDEHYDDFSPMLEMQLTLSRNATTVQQYVGRNVRVGLRVLQWHREQHPDLLAFATMSSEYAQNFHSNAEYCDYSSWSQQEFRDWLSGTNLYAGQGQYASLAALNADANVNAATGAGFPFASWTAVMPPTNVDWSTTTDTGRWWRKWNDFRIAQVRNMEQAQINWCGDAGWSPDLLFGHQIPFDPNTTDEAERKFASPWTTTFVANGANGITTYDWRASDLNIFNAVRANDQHWGIFEYNPLNTSVAANLSALDSVWNSQGRIVCPYAWYGQPTYQIIDQPFETALAQFIYNHRNQAYTNLAPWEVSPVMKDVIWAMSETDDVETSAGVTGLQFTNGILTGTITSPTPVLSLELNESASRYLIADGCFAASLRMYLSNSVPGLGQFSWVNEFGVTNSVSFPAQPGWNVYRINLAENAAWRGQRIKQLEFRPASTTGAFSLDWFRLEANPCWHFDAAGEFYGANQLTNAGVSGGVLSAVSGPDGYFYLATDQRDPNVDADRAWIDADVFKKVRVRLTTSAAGTAELFWWKRGATFFNFSSTSFAVGAGTQMYEVDLSANPNWSGQITRFRLDPVNAAGVNVAVDYVSLSPVLLAPRITHPDLIVNSSTPVFLWEKALEPNHSGVVSDLQVATDFGFTNVFLVTNGIVGNRWTYDGSLGALDGFGWWRVRSRDQAGNVSAWATPMPMFVRVWNCNQLADVLQTNNFGTASITGGVWQATTTGGDPYLYLNNGGVTGRGINVNVYNRVRCRVRVSSGGATFIECFLFPRSGGFLSKSLPLAADNQWHDLVFDFANTPGLTNSPIDYIRLDPSAGLVGVQVSLDSVELLPALEPMAQSGVWQFNTNGNAEGWSLTDAAALLAVTNGTLTLDLIAANAAVQIAPVALDSRQFNLFQMRMRNATAANTAKLYWATDADPFFAETRSATLPVVANDPVFTIYNLNLSTNAAWTNSPITALRWLPATNAATGRVEVDWITITSPTATNQPPGFTKGGNQTVLEDSGPSTVVGWATAISPGPPGESWQSVSFACSNSNAGIFSAPPTVAINGTLAFTPAPNANGTATVTVWATDDGGTANGGQNTSAPQTFTITVTAVNDAPSFTKGPDVTIAEDAGAQSFLNWATNLNRGAPDEAAQGVSFSVTNGNNALFSAQPAINSSGTLAFTPASNAFGSASIGVRMTDSGGTANGGQNSSAWQTFLITVNAVNEAPVAGADAVFAHWNTTSSLSVSNLLANDSDPDGGTLAITAVTPGANTATVALSNSVVLYTPVAGFAGNGAFTYLLSDVQGGQATGAVSVVVVKPEITAWAILAGNAFRLEFQGIPNTAYRLQVSTNLTTWFELFTNSTAGNGHLQFDDGTAPASAIRFYRFDWP